MSYADYLDGRRVVLVGPAPYLQGQSRGAWIDRFDVVVRINQGFMMIERHAADLGTRTDVLYLARYIHEYRWLDRARLERIRWRFCRTANQHGHVDLGLKAELTARFGFYPRTGVVAIYHLLAFPLAELQVVGFTGYYGEKLHVDGYFNDWEMTEAFVLQGDDRQRPRARELEIFRDCLLADGRLRLDDVMRERLAR